MKQTTTEAAQPRQMRHLGRRTHAMRADWGSEPDVREHRVERCSKVRVRKVQATAQIIEDYHTPPRTVPSGRDQDMERGSDLWHCGTVLDLRLLPTPSLVSVVPGSATPSLTDVCSGFVVFLNTDVELSRRQATLPCIFEGIE